MDEPILNWDIPDKQQATPVNPFEDLIKAYQVAISRAEKIGMIPEQVPLLMVRFDDIAKPDTKDCPG